MQRPMATGARARAGLEHCEPHEKLNKYAAWLDVRAKSSRGNPDDRARAAEASRWLKHWLSRLCSPATTTFIMTCAEGEIAALADGMESPKPDAPV
jgi:hypothetical protein